MSFVLSFFPRDVLNEIWDLIESVSGFFIYFYCSTSNGLHEKKTEMISHDIYVIRIHINWDALCFTDALSDA